MDSAWVMRGMAKWWWRSARAGREGELLAAAVDVAERAVGGCGGELRRYIMASLPQIEGFIASPATAIASAAGRAPIVCPYSAQRAMRGVPATSLWLSNVAGDAEQAPRLLSQGHARYCRATSSNFPSPLHSEVLNQRSPSSCHFDKIFSGSSGRSLSPCCYTPSSSSSLSSASSTSMSHSPAALGCLPFGNDDSHSYNHIGQQPCKSGMPAASGRSFFTSRHPDYHGFSREHRNRCLPRLSALPLRQFSTSLLTRPCLRDIRSSAACISPSSILLRPSVPRTARPSRSFRTQVMADNSPVYASGGSSSSPPTPPPRSESRLDVWEKFDKGPQQELTRPKSTIIQPPKAPTPTPTSPSSAATPGGASQAGSSSTSTSTAGKFADRMVGGDGVQGMTVLSPTTLEEAFRTEGEEDEDEEEEEWTEVFTIQSTDIPIPVQAHYVASSIDLKKLQEMEFPRNRWWQQGNGMTVAVDALVGQRVEGGTDPASERILVAYTYGSIVAFNFSDGDLDALLRSIAKYGTKLEDSPIPGSTKPEEYSLVVRSDLDTWSRYDTRADFILLQQLDLANVRTVSEVLAISVALNHYERRVDEMLRLFGDINLEMERTGDFSMDRQRLFKLVAINNRMFTDALQKIKVLERSETAWRYAKYSAIWDALRFEFEIAGRYEAMTYKLELIQHNMKFFLEVLQNRKSDLLEWIIILLIAAEILLGLYGIFNSPSGGGTHGGSTSFVPSAVSAPALPSSSHSLTTETKPSNQETLS